MGKGYNNLQGDVGVFIGATVAVLGGIAALVIGSSQKKKGRDKANAALSDIGDELADLRSKFLGNVRFSDRINELKGQQKTLREKRDKRW